MSKAKYFFLFILAVAVFLAVRHWLDREREKTQGIDIVRADMDEGDSHLGSWAQKNDSTLLLLRLQRDGNFNYRVVTYPKNDTLKYTGQYRLLPSVVTNNGLQYPHLIAISTKGDTIINHFIQITRATKKNIDILSLAKNNIPGSPAILFYRIKQ
ncbi:MAG: hypothetical protein KF741_02820 [Ferruginibacter sp.]|nr:hypothetical protein [Bacteroidota bacterium]MBX2918154.1 hypothetical protein [Ferruginibacter sp.]MCB0708624.1 hypothetical protein [Chitinophagaceae bacterium]